MPSQRIDKIIASQGNLSRADVKMLIKNGSVKVNGNIIKESSAKFDAEDSVIEINGQALVYKRYIYIMMNKPQGIISASNDKKAKTVIALVTDELFREGLFPAGRLDADTTGFVLLTDDGDFAHKILSPKNHVEKTYEALLEYPIDEEVIEKFKQGIELSDGTKCMPAKLIKMSETESKVEIIICEGKYHQIKRMFAACSNKVLSLKRIKIGNLNLDTKLKEGECREITKKELLLIFNK